MFERGHSAQYPSIAEHPLLATVRKWAWRRIMPDTCRPGRSRSEELMRQWMLGCGLCHDDAGGRRRFSGANRRRSLSRVSAKTRDITDLTNSEIQQFAGRAGTARKRPRRFRHHDAFALYRLDAITKGLTGRPEAIDSQF